MLFAIRLFFLLLSFLCVICRLICSVKRAELVKQEQEILHHGGSFSECKKLLDQAHGYDKAVKIWDMGWFACILALIV